MTTINDRIARTEAQLERLRKRAEATKAFADAYLGGASVIEIAMQTGTDINIIYAALRQASVKMRGHDRSKLMARREAIIAARREGRDISDIGREFGITRERVRQIIATAGDPSLIGWRRSRRLPRPACAVCGKPCGGRHAKTCSIECRAVAAQGTGRNLRTDWRANYERAKAMRAEGMTWNAVAAALGIGTGSTQSGSQACNAFARWERYAASDNGSAA